MTKWHRAKFKLIELSNRIELRMLWWVATASGDGLHRNENSSGQWEIIRHSDHIADCLMTFQPTVLQSARINDDAFGYSQGRSRFQSMLSAVK